MMVSEYKVGDELAFRIGYSRTWQIHKITNITPSGRIQCGRWTLNPDLGVRGHSGYHSPFQAYPVTAEIRATVIHQDNVSVVRGIDVSKLTGQQIADIADIVRSGNDGK